MSVFYFVFFNYRRKKKKNFLNQSISFHLYRSPAIWSIRDQPPGHTQLLRMSPGRSQDAGGTIPPSQMASQSESLAVPSESLPWSFPRELGKI